MFESIDDRREKFWRELAGDMRSAAGQDTSGSEGFTHLARANDDDSACLMCIRFWRRFLNACGPRLLVLATVHAFVSTRAGLAWDKSGAWHISRETVASVTFPALLVLSAITLGREFGKDEQNFKIAFSRLVCGTLVLAAVLQFIVWKPL